MRTARLLPLLTLPAILACGRPAPPPAVVGSDGCPGEMVPVPGAAACIDRYEASSDGGALGAPNGEGTGVAARSVEAAAPLVGVTVAQADRACRNAGKRLCEDDEWIDACRGEAKLAYGYGSDYEAGRCNDWEASRHGATGAARTGAFARCRAAAGAFDMTNNVGEWTSKPVRGDQHAVRGGTWNMSIHDSRCEAKGYTAPPDSQRPDIGFRCCRAKGP